jgi:hypothetical protein
MEYLSEPSRRHANVKHESPCCSSRAYNLAEDLPAPASVCSPGPVPGTSLPSCSERSNGFATEPSAHASSTKHDHPSHPTPRSAHRRPCLTRRSTSRMGFFVYTFVRKRSTNDGICSSSGGVSPCGAVTRSEGDCPGPVTLLPGAASSWDCSGRKSTPMSVLGVKRPSKTSHWRIVSALARCGGIRKKSRDGSYEVAEDGAVRAASMGMSWRCCCC